MEYSVDQARARDRIEAVLRAAGVDLAEAALMPDGGGPQPTLAVIGKAGSGKTMLLADLVRGLVAAGVEPVSADYESRKRADEAHAGGAGADQQGRERAARPRRAGDHHPPHPLHAALSSRLRGDRRVADRQGRPAEGRGADRGGARPGAGVLSRSIRRSRGRWRPRGCGARTSSRAGSGARSRSTSGWSTRPRCSTSGSTATCGISSGTLVLFGDPAQLAPVGGTGGMVFDDLPDEAQAHAAPGAPAGGRQPDPRPRACAGRPGARVPRLRGPGAAGGAARRRGW